MSKYYDRQGNPITEVQWGRMQADREYLVVAYHERQGVAVSTVWLGIDLGIDHSFGQGGPPVIFETMVFGLPTEPCYRYSTEQEAKEGHNRTCAEVFGQ